jgi:outer membrane protein OmpA-like peptidoglycan-associated protein
MLGAVAVIPAGYASSQPVDGPYVSLGVGPNFNLDQTLQPQRVPTGFQRGKLDYGYDPGISVLAALGYGLGNGLRLELEGDYNYASVGRLRNRGFNQGNTVNPVNGSGGNNQWYGGFFNALYDFDLGLPVTPYLGVGVGGQVIQLSARNFGFQGVQVPNNSRSAGNFSYQAILGASYSLDSVVPGLALTAEYRFVGILPTDFGSEQLSGPLGVTTRSKVQLSDTFSNQILFGVRYAFNHAPPPPPPAPVVAPAPAVARSYLVFFDWDKATLTDRARQIIADAAQNSTRVQYTRIEVNGYTDTSGTPRYNQGLSVRRAQAVAAELVKDGVPNSAIAIQGFGETHLLVPTGANVREPQNRRVEIVIR